MSSDTSNMPDDTKKKVPATYKWGYGEKKGIADACGISKQAVTNIFQRKNNASPEVAKRISEYVCSKGGDILPEQLTSAKTSDHEMFNPIGY